MPKALAESALWMAMSASSSALGSGFTAVTVHQHLIRHQHEKHAGDNSGARRGLDELQGGRMVLAVVCTAPETRPSTSFTASIMVPSTTLSSRYCSAMCAVSPVGGAARPAAARAGAGVVGVEDFQIGRRGDALGVGHFCTASGLASSTQRAMPVWWQITAASTVRGSSPSGSTMRLPAWRVLNQPGSGSRRRQSLARLANALVSRSRSSRSATKSTTRSMRARSSTGTWCGSSASAGGRCRRFQLGGQHREAGVFVDLAQRLDAGAAANYRSAAGRPAARRWAAMAVATTTSSRSPG